MITLDEAMASMTRKQLEEWLRDELWRNDQLLAALERLKAERDETVRTQRQESHEQ